MGIVDENVTLLWHSTVDTYVHTYITESSSSFLITLGNMGNGCPFKGGNSVNFFSSEKESSIKGKNLPS